jgi:dipeptidyl-peptidase 4
VADSFPRQKARTRNFTLGVPRSFEVAPDGSRVAFLRSPAGDDPRTALWVYDVGEGRERLIVDAADLTDGPAEALSNEERARRERARETAEGVVAYATDRDVRIAAFVVSGRLFVADLLAGGVRALAAPAPVFDPRPDPPGQRIAFVHDRGLHVVDLADGAMRRVAGEPEEAVSWGMAEFVAAEEMGRSRGYWWAPDGEGLLVARVDEAPVDRLWISDVAHPASPPRAVRYPRAGTANASVQLHLLRLDGEPALPVPSVPVAWDAEAYPYLTRAGWDEHGPLIAVQARDQRRVLVLGVDSQTGATTSLASQSDEAWVDLVPGVPRRLSGGRLVTAAAVEDATAVLVNGRAVTPPTMEVTQVLAASEEEVLFAAVSNPTDVQLHTWNAENGLRSLTSSPGVHTAAGSGAVRVIGSRGMEHDGVRWVLGDHVFESRGERPVLTPSVRLLTVGERQLHVGLVLPRDHEPGQALPVLMDPYGGPQHQRVMADRHRWLEPQWFADQGFAVIVADGRGTPGRGCAWARAVHGDLAGPVLEDQIDALVEVAALEPDLDLGRVGIRGWSFGGFLAALAVLRRPDVFHAAVAGAPVTDWRLYDTHYTERYLGVEPDGADRRAYEGSSLLGDAAALRRPLLLIHGLVDDNVLAAHTLELSQLLTESGRLHAVLPLTGITHMTPQEAVAENLLTVQVDFLRRALGQRSAVEA